MNRSAPVAGTAAATVERSLRLLRQWLEANRFEGIEPHDALTSPLIQRTPIGRSRGVRLAALQGLRRLPLDIRPLLGVRPRVNAISLGWALAAYALLDDAEAEPAARDAMRRLRELEVPGYSGSCLGYYFDWQTRTGFKPAGHPIIVSTAFICEGILDWYDRSGDPALLAWARSGCEFILRDLNRSEHPTGICFSYSPTDHEQVYNASILGAALLALVGALTGERELLETAQSAVDFVVANQAADGSWAYAWGDHRTFVDNFHTGYVLCALRRSTEYGGDDRHREALERGWRFYRDSFFEDDVVPKYYHDRLYPIDAHALAQSIVTLLEFGDGAHALRVALWGIERMQRPGGDFIYQIHRRFTNAIAYLRWSNAWMFHALARLDSAIARGEVDA